MKKGRKQNEARLNEIKKAYKKWPNSGDIAKLLGLDRQLVDYYIKTYIAKQ